MFICGIGLRSIATYTTFLSLDQRISYCQIWVFDHDSVKLQHYIILLKHFVPQIYRSIDGQGTYSTLNNHRINKWLNAVIDWQSGYAFNSLVPGRFENNFQNVFFKLISWIDTLINSCETVLKTTTEPIWREVNIVSGNGLVPSGNKPLPAPILSKIAVAIWRY